MAISQQLTSSDACTVKIQQLLLGLSQVSHTLAQVADLDTAINQAIRDIGQFLQVDRVYIFANHPQTPQPTVSQRWEWVAAAGFTTQSSNTERQDLPDNQLYQQWYAQLSQQQIISGLASSFPASEQALLQAWGIQSILVIPIWQQGRFWGFIGLDDCHSEREWSDIDRSILTTIAAHIGSTIQHHETAIALEQVVGERSQALRKSEERFRQFVEKSHEVMATWKSDSTITYMSPNYYELSGHRVADLVGTSFVPLVHAEDLYICQHALGQVIETGNSVSNVEFRNINHDGSTTWVSLSIAPVKNAQGEIESFQGLLRNISQQKHLEHQLREQIALSDCRAQIGTVLTHADTHALRPALQTCTEVLVKYLDAAFARIWTISDDGSTLELQASAGIYTHIDGDHARVPVGKFKIGLIAAEKQPHLTNDVLNDPRVGDKDWAAANGMVAFAGYPLMVEDKILGVVAMFTKHSLNPSVLELLGNIAAKISLHTKRHFSEAELHRQTVTLQTTLNELQQTQSHLIQSEKMSSLGEMVAGVAHEINNPVNFIHGNINHVNNYSQDLIALVTQYQQELSAPSTDLQTMLEEIDLPFLLDDFPKVLTSMKGGTQRIREIVLTLRNFSRLDEADMKDVDIHDGIDSTILILQNKIKSNAARPAIQINREYGELSAIYCYAGQLNQVFMNILANAIDAMEEAYTTYVKRGIRDYQPNLTIRTVMTERETVQIAIQDNALGIPAAVQSRLFDPFFTTKPVGQGTGLGLSISYQIIVDKHNGQLTCESSLGKGTTFTIELPIIEVPLDE
ncbi:GAF domain-containing protein [filamentous cyanobacterium LEGE 11480]|uniref:histidine kinase n=1 Tax=Romeriopsis navalis LEGE 11480 TaxID=2777977 RepID=A0A928Z773_9CYAN|nr:GAF domain-containing protein [Romeriopsis navalis]MBE9032930.1 GAF domain-containing protein [Romeriopsis navalis LEGE 11480]